LFIPHPLRQDFSRYNLNATGEINEHDAMRLLEARGATKTATELRQLFNNIDIDRNRHISFLEWCCAYYQRSYEDLNTFADEAARELAMQEVQTDTAHASLQALNVNM
jgi:Ca2+-binding EF-hand superfamily protein